MQKKLKLGIIGVGGIGTIHAEAHQAASQADIDAIYASSEQGREVAI